MSFVTTQPEALSAAATSLGGIGAGLNAQNAAAAAPTTGVIPAAADEVSALTAAQFAAHAQLYQAVSAQAAAIHEAVRQHVGHQRRFLLSHRGCKRSRRRLSVLSMRTVPLWCHSQWLPVSGKGGISRVFQVGGYLR